MGLSSLRRWVSSAVGCLGTWGALGASIWALSQDLRLGNLPVALVLATCPALAVLFGSWSARRLSKGAARIGFLVPTLIGAAIVGLLMEGQFEHGFKESFFSEIQGLAVARQEFLSGLFVCGAIPILTGVGVLLCRKREGMDQVDAVDQVDQVDLVDAGGPWRELAMAVAIVAVLGAAAWFAWDRYSREMQAEGLRQWARIGRPMEAFDKKEVPVAQNASLQELLEDLRPFGVTNLYKAGTLKNPDGGGKPEHFSVSEEELDLLKYGQTRTDSVSIPADKAASMAARSEELLLFYRRILNRPVPVWESDPHDAYEIAVPNFLLMRKMAQTMKVDALVRFSRGDRDGAREALWACDRFSQGLLKNPTLVSLMIRVAVEGLLANATARLPYEENGLAQLEKEAPANSARLKDYLQQEAWVINALADGTVNKPAYFADENFQRLAASATALGNLPRWFRNSFLLYPLLRMQSRYASNVMTGMIAFWDRMDLLTASDLGYQVADRLMRENPLAPNVSFTRALTRIYCTALVREQSQLIRFARAQMLNGQLAAKSEKPSVVIPGAKWELTFDAAARTVALRLTPIPAWVSRAEGDGCLDENLRLLSLDGDQAWKFDLP